MNVEFQDDDVPGTPANPALDPQLAAALDALLEQGMADGADISALRNHPFGDVIAKLGANPAILLPPGLAARTIAAARQTALPPPVRTRRNTKHALHVGANPRVIDMWVMAAAACLLMVVMFFTLKQARVHALRAACAENLQVIGQAMGQYATTYADYLPQITPPADRNWMPRSAPTGVERSTNAHSNLANLAPLVEGSARYTSWERLICPGQPHSAVDLNTERCPSWGKLGYSYIDELGPYHHHWSTSDMIPVMADANPVVCQTAGCTPNSNSENHGGMGQNVLFSSGNVVWETTADVGPHHNNIFTLGNPPEVVYNGTEEPHTQSDVFLVP